MRQGIFRSLVFCLLCLSSVYATATPDATLPPKVQSFIASIEAEKPKLQGGAIAILHHGKTVYKTTFGHQKGKGGAAITSSTLFPLASVSKPVSATALALMVDRGTLDLDQPHKISYLKNEVNLQHLLSHTTGYLFSGNTQIERGLSRTKLLEQLKWEKPGCNPGGCYRYSNTTFSLVEEALATQSSSLSDAIQQLRATLKTEGIQVVPLKPGAQVAYPHAYVKAKNQKTAVLKTLPFPPYYPKAAPAAAGVFASLDGMIELYRLQFGYRSDLISKKTLDRFQTPVIANRDIEKWHINWPCPRNMIESYYGLGWRILKAKKYPEKELIFHPGHIAGTVSFVGFIPAEDIGIIILINENSGNALKKGINFWGRFLS